MTFVDLKPASQNRAPVAGSQRRQALLLGLLLVIAVLAIYYPVNRQPFANYDDADYVFDNFHVKSGLHWETIRWAFTTRDAANWHPVTWISHALDCQIFGLDPAGPHDVNVLLHLVNALLLFWVLYRATGFIGRSWMVAALFAVHPMNVESVAWIAERKNLLSMFFFLLTLAAYRWYASKPQDKRYVVVAALFALGLMSKPQVITLPFVLLLWDYWPLRRFWLDANEPPPMAGMSNAAIPTRTLSALLWEKVPLLALCGVSAYFTLTAQAAGGATSGYGHAMRLQNAIVSYARYLGKAIWPSRLAVFYPYPLSPYKMWQVAAAMLLLVIITAAVAIGYRRRYLTVGWLWLLGTLVPMIGVVQVGTQAMADRYAYLPFVGLFIMVCWLVADWAQQVRVAPMFLRTVSVMALLALILVAHRQVTYWNDHITLWTHALEVTNNNWVAENNLGAALLKEARVEEAIPHFRAAAALDPSDPNSNLNIGTYEQMHGNLLGAIERYKTAVSLSRNPRTKAKAYNNLGYAYKEIGDLSDERASFQGAVEYDPEFVGAWIGLGLAAQRTGDLPAAIDAYSRAMQLHPSDFGYLLLAQALQQNGDREQSEAARHKAELLSPNMGAAQRSANQLLAH